MQLKATFLHHPRAWLSRGWEQQGGEAGCRECPAHTGGHGTAFAVLESPGETGAGGGIAVAARDTPVPGKAALTAPSSASRARLLGGNTPVVSVIWQLSSALKETFLKEIEYILLSPLHFLDRLAKGGTFPLSHSSFYPLFFFFLSPDVSGALFQAVRTW